MLFVGGVAASSTESVATAYVFFTERIFYGLGHLRVEDCGPDFNCSTRLDDPEEILISCFGNSSGIACTNYTHLENMTDPPHYLTFGSGMHKGGGDEYGSLQIT